jgi:TolB-like protein/DNA-binding winged helix-turn-helix (wHTH) protein/tetratricopeptide (TPR) repeat protein
VFDPATGRLQVGTQSHLLDHGSAGVLHCLAQARCAVVRKDDLLAKGWPGRVVSENSLNKAVSRIRSLLGDGDGELLCTSHGYGYRLIATETALGDATIAGDEAADAARPTVPTTTPTGGAPLARDDGESTRNAGARSRLAWASAAMLAGAVALFTALPPRADPARAPSPVAGASGSASDDTANSPVLLPSIAVLPFTDLSQAHDQAYFSDGLAEEILDRLAKLPQLRVASRTSAFALRGNRDSVAGIGRKLGVSTVLEGSVRRSGSRVRITVQLIQVSDGFHLWSETYDQEMTELFTVQDDISRSVVDALQLHLPPAELAAMTRHTTRSPAAFNQFLIARQLRNGSPDGERRAIAGFERAIAIDPAFSTAIAELGNTLGGDAIWADTPAQVEEGKLRSVELLGRAIELEPDNASYYTTRADLLSSTMHDWTGAQRDLASAARLYGGPSARLLVQQSRILAMLGRIDEAIAIDRRAVSLNPSGVTPLGMLGYHLAVAGRHDEARAILRRAVALRPDDDHTTYYLGLAELLAGRPASAMAAFEQSGHGLRLAGLAAAEHDAGNEARSREALDALVARYADADAYQVAEAHAWRGERDEAFAWLERAARQRDAGLVQLQFDPLMRPLRDDARYLAWLRRLNLRDAASAPANATSLATRSP